MPQIGTWRRARCNHGHGVQAVQVASAAAVRCDPTELDLGLRALARRSTGGWRTLVSANPDNRMLKLKAACTMLIPSRVRTAATTAGREPANSRLALKREVVPGADSTRRSTSVGKRGGRFATRADTVRERQLTHQTLKSPAQGSGRELRPVDGCLFDGGSSCAGAAVNDEIVSDGEAGRMRAQP